ncbi:MAG: hypothetical protein LBT31_01765 [Synergistaceae bacterium]|nr:hypothetical protein [Synergistaceae bacterium]
MGDPSRQLNCYKPSGAAPFGGVVATLLAGTAAGSLLGAVYAFANYHIPLIYLNVLLVALLGCVLGKIVSKCVHKFQIRNVIMAAVMGFVAFSASYAAHWFFYISTVLIDWETDSPYDIAAIIDLALSLTQNPADAFELIQELNEEGVWSITGSSGNNTGLAPTGIALALLWAAEAIVICFYSVKEPIEEAGKPFSERMDRWLTAQEIPTPIAFIENVGDFVNAVARNDYSALTTPLPKAGEELPEDGKRATVVMYPDSMESYISVKNLYEKKKKKKDRKTKEVIRYMKVPPEVAQKIIASLA